MIWDPNDRFTLATFLCLYHKRPGFLTSYTVDWFGVQMFEKNVIVGFVDIDGIADHKLFIIMCLQK